jgi:hypothetical protein
MPIVPLYDLKHAVPSHVSLCQEALAGQVEQGMAPPVAWCAWRWIPLSLHMSHVRMLAPSGSSLALAPFPPVAARQEGRDVQDAGCWNPRESNAWATA